MASSFCLQKEAAAAFRQALKDGTLDPEKLADLDSDARREAFAKVVGKDNARDVNTLFESKLVLKNVQQGILNWAKSIANLKERADMTSRIEKMDKILDPVDEQAFYKDLAAQKLKVNVTYDEVKKVSELTQQLRKLAGEKDANGNNTPEYFKQLRTTTDYVKSLDEHSVLQQLATISRNFLLLSVKTPTKVTVEQTFNRGVEGLVKTLAYRGKGLNGDVAHDYVKNAIKIYGESGFNQAAMNYMDEGNMFGDVFSHHEGTSTGTKGGIRVFSKKLDRVVIHYLHGVVFNAHFNGAFAGTVDRESTRIAKSEGLTGDAQKTRAEEIMRSAFQIGTLDPIGAEVRALGQKAAMRVTNSNKTFGSGFAQWLKGNLNNAPGLQWAHLGDWTVPFSKIPGSIIANNLGAAGFDIPRGIYEFKQAVTEGRSTGKYDFSQPAITLTRMAGVVGASAIVTAFLGNKDYDAKKDAFKIGNYWVSSELFGPLGPAMTGMMEARNAPAGESKLWAPYNYGGGAVKSLTNLPGIREAKDMYQYGLADFLENFLSSRVSPAIIGDTIKAYHEDTPLPVIAGARLRSVEQKSLEDKESKVKSRATKRERLVQKAQATSRFSDQAR